MFDLQGLADDLCDKLGRSIAVDNEHVEVIAASAQVGRIDEVRSDAILNRRTRPDVVAYVEDLSLAHATEAVVVPPHPKLRTLPRWCFPVRTGPRLLGFLWIINDPPLSDEELALARSYADKIRETLASNIEHADAILRTSIQLTEALLRDGRRDALSQATRSGLLLALGPAVVWSFVLSGQDGSRKALTTADIIELLTDLLTTTRPGSFIGAPSEDRLALVTKVPSGAFEHDALLRAVQLSCRRKRLQLRASGRTVLLAAEDPREAHERAAFTASVARWDGEDSVREWERLGAWTLLKGASWNAEQVRSLSPSAFAIVQQVKSSLAETLLAYLDTGGSAPETCRVLHIQRATLYYRLGRIKEIAGDEILSSGWEQTSAHIALRVWQAHQRALASDEQLTN